MSHVRIVQPSQTHLDFLSSAHVLVQHDEINGSFSHGARSAWLVNTRCGFCRFRIIAHIASFFCEGGLLVSTLLHLQGEHAAVPHAPPDHLKILFICLSFAFTIVACIGNIVGAGRLLRETVSAARSVVYGTAALFINADVSMVRECLTCVIPPQRCLP